MSTARIFLEDLREGDVFRGYETRMITDEELASFAVLSGDMNPLHTDREWARDEGPFGRPIAHGLLITSAASGLPGPWDDWAYIALLEVSRRFEAPVYPGERIGLEVVIASRRVSRSTPSRGILGTDVRIINGDGKVVQSGHELHMLRTRPVELD